MAKYPKLVAVPRTFLDALEKLGTAPTAGAASSIPIVRGRTMLVGWFLMSVVGVVQQPALADPFERLAFVIGKWEGASDGQPGKGTVRREYARALTNRFIRVQNRSEYPPKPKNPKGEIHEDEGFFSRQGAQAGCVAAVSHRRVRQYLR